MTDLAAWLLEQIAEREKIAKAAAARVRRWPKSGPKQVRPPWVIARAVAERERYAVLERFEGRETPDEVLAECAARRRLVELHAAYKHPCTERDADWGNLSTTAWPCLTLVLLAQTYADRPGFDPSWRLEQHTG